MCHNALCQHVSHVDVIRKLYKDFVKWCHYAGLDSIPLKKLCINCVPGWKDKVKPERDVLIFWHWMWLECSKPNIG